MKNLKMFAIGLAAFAAMTMGVHAASTTACNKPGQTLSGVSVNCEASVNNDGYAKFSDAWTEVIANGGTLELYADATIKASDYDVTKDVTIEAGKYTFTIDNAHHLNVKTGATLTVNNGTFKITQTSSATPFIVDKGGALVLNDVTTTLGGTLITNNGTATVKGGNITDTCIADPVFDNNGTLTLNGTKVDASKAQTVVRNSGVATLEDITVDAAASTLVITAKHNSEATLVSGTYSVKRVLDDSLSNGPVASNGEVGAKVVIKGGTYNTTSQAIEADKGVELTIEDGTFTVISGTAMKIYAADVIIKGGTFTANNGYVIDTVAATTDSGAPNASLTISGGNFIAASRSSKYVINIGRAKMTYAITGGTFESKGADKLAAIRIGLATPTTTKNGVTNVADVVKGILTGGKYLNNIIAKMENADGATIDVSDELVAEGYTVKVEDPYKLVVSTNPVEDPEQQDPNVGDGGANTPADTNPNVPDVPKTNDNILVYAGLGLVSALTVGFSAKRKENN